MKMKIETAEPDHVFSCAFGGGVTATATVDMSAARSGRDEQWIKVRFDGTVTQAHLPLYRSWMLDVNQKVADLLGRTVFWGFGPDEKASEVYQFEAGQPYRRVR